MKRLLLASVLLPTWASAQPVNQYLQAPRNLSDVPSKPLARSNLGVVNAATIAPLTTTIGTGVTTLWNAASFYSIRIQLPSNVQISCTGDGSTPVLGTSYPTANYAGQTIFWPNQPGGLMPTGAVKCIAATSTSFASSGSTTYLEAH